jgi:hypothetical protein
MRKEHAQGLDNRRRDSDGEIRHKRGNTLVATLRKTYGSDFAAGYRGDTKLSTLLAQTGTKSLGEYIEHSTRGNTLHKSNGTSTLSNTIFSVTSSHFGPALKSLAKR